MRMVPLLILQRGTCQYTNKDDLLIPNKREEAMNKKGRHILDVWGYYRLNAQLLLMAILLAFAGFTCSSAHGAGFGRGPHPKRVDDRMAFLTEKLQLTSEQQTEVRPILEAVYEKQNDLLEEARNQDRLAWRELRSQMQSIATETQKPLTSILTPGQMASYEELMEERRAAIQERGKGRKGVGW